MKAVCWHGAMDVRVENVPDPTILNPRDAIIKITSTAICGFDLHIYGAIQVPPGIPDEKLLFIADAIPTGFMGADLCDIQPGDTVAVWGAGA